MTSDTADHESPSILSKAFELLHAFNQTARVMTLSELARAANLPKSTVHRLLGRLIDLDAVEQHGHGYRLSLSIMRLGATTPAASLRQVAAPHLSALLHYTGRTVHLGVLRGLDVVCLEKLSPHVRTETSSEIGSRWLASRTALGKALLAHEHLDQLREQLCSPLPRCLGLSESEADELIAELRQVSARGLAYADGELRGGLSCIASPIVIQMGVPRAVGALSVSFPTGASDAAKIGNAVLYTAGKLSVDATCHAANHQRWLPVCHDEP